MFLRGRGQVHPRQSLAGRLFYFLWGIPDVGMQLRALHVLRGFYQSGLFLPDCSPSRLLDAGCGSGRITLMLARRFPKAELVGFDPDPSVLLPARERQQYGTITNVRFVSDLAEVTGTFDAIVAADVIAHVPDRDVFGRFLAAHAAPGARLILHTPTGEGKPHFARHRHFDRQQADRVVPFVTREELQSWLGRYGFVPRRWVTTFRRWGGGLAWELNQIFSGPLLFLQLANLWMILELFVPTAGGGVLVVAERKAGR